MRQEAAKLTAALGLATLIPQIVTEEAMVAAKPTWKPGLGPFDPMPAVYRPEPQKTEAIQAQTCSAQLSSCNSNIQLFSGRL